MREKWRSLWNRVNWSLKLVLSFLCILMIFLASSLYIVHQLREVGQQMIYQNEAINHKVLALTIKQEVQELATIKYGVMISRSLDELDRYAELRKQAEANIEQLAEVASTAELRKKRSMLTTVFGEYAGTFDTVVEMVRDSGAQPELSNKLQSLYNQSQAHKEYLFELVDEFNAAHEQIASSAVAQSTEILEQTMRITVIAVSFTFIMTVILGSMLILSFVRPIGRLQQTVSLIAEGDLRHKIKSTAQDELGQLSKHFDLMIDKVRGMLGRTQEIASQMSEQSGMLRQVSTTTATANADIMRAIQEMSVGTDKQASQSEIIAGMAAEVESDVQGIAEFASRVKQKSLEASSNTSIGSSAVAALNAAAEQTDQTYQKVFEAIDLLSASTSQIDKIVHTIAEISTQTNVLALNAAIEAARAGQEGLGFSVIADEVRQLSTQVNDSAKSIAQIIQTVHQGMNEVRNQMSRAKQVIHTQNSKISDTQQAFGAIDQSVQLITEHIGQIYQKIEQAQARNEQLVQSVHLVSSISQETAAGVEEVASTSIVQNEAIAYIAEQAEETYRMAQSLFVEVNRFKMVRGGD
jgi:methyl-accepting chemotaxis protein